MVERSGFAPSWRLTAEKRKEKALNYGLAGHGPGVKKRNEFLLRPTCFVPFDQRRAVRMRTRGVRLGFWSLARSGPVPKNQV